MPVSTSLSYPSNKLLGYYRMSLRDKDIGASNESILEFREHPLKSTPQRSRTSNLRIRSPMLYPVELGVRGLLIMPENRRGDKVGAARVVTGKE